MNTPDALRREFATMAEQVGLDQLRLHVHRVPRSVASSGIDNGQPVVYLDPALVTAPWDVLRAILGHEIGHHRLGHQTWRTNFLLIAPLLVSVALATGGMVGFVLGSGPATATSLLLAVAGLLSSCALGRRQHLLADDFAASEFHAPITAEVVRVLDASGSPDRRVPKLLRSHPTWQKRLSRARARHNHD